MGLLGGEPFHPLGSGKVRPRAVTEALAGAVAAGGAAVVDAAGAGVPAVAAGAPAGVALKTSADGRTTVAVPKRTPASRFKLIYAERAVDPGKFSAAARLNPLPRGGPALFPQTFTVEGQLDPNAATKTYAVDVIPLPSENPWRSPTR